MKKNEPQQELLASDVLNWEHLVAISEKPEGRAENFDMAMRHFAYSFTSTADQDRRDTMLSDMLRNATDHHSKESAEDVVKTLATKLNCDRKELRKFARQCGVRLQLDRWLAWRDPTFSNP